MKILAETRSAFASLGSATGQPKSSKGARSNVADWIAGPCFVARG